MVVAVWSAKGGVGVSSVAALLAIGQAQRAEETLLVDLCGDMPALLGIDHDDAATGLVDWCALEQPTADTLARLEVDVQPRLRLVPRGRGHFGLDEPALIEVLSGSTRRVIVDCGLVSDATSLHASLVSAASTSLLVVRECFLNLRAAQASGATPTGVIVIKEPGRRLGRADVEAVTHAPVVAEFAFDPAIARSIDAGLARSRLPRQLVRAVGKVLADAA